MSIKENIKGCLIHIPYTAKHWWAFQKTSIKYLHFPLFIFHDILKLLLYIVIPFVGELTINNWHRRFELHHLTYWKGDVLIEKELSDYPEWLRTLIILEAIIDWECARFTKPDKPLNARETLYKYYPSYAQYVEPWLDRLGL